MIFAGGSLFSTSMFSSTETKATFWLGSTGADTRILFVSSGIATPSPKSSLTAFAILFDVVKSPWCRFKTTKSVLKNSVGTIRSTAAPRGILPTVGILIVSDELSAPSTPRPPTTTFP